MAKLADMLGKYLVEWPDNTLWVAQGPDGKIYNNNGSVILYSTFEDCIDPYAVTQSEYLAARDRIAAEECTELPKPDRKLWKRAALVAFAGYCARPGMDAECAAEEAMYAADAFMNAMEKHLNGGE